MSTKRPSLGRGLGALLGQPATAAEAPAVAQLRPDEELVKLPVDLLQRGKYQPRIDMHTETLQELADSIKAQGLIQPILVRPLGDAAPGQPRRYEIIAGERRWRAAQLAGLHEIPSIVRRVPDEAAVAMALIENIQREGLNPLEEASAYQQLLEDFGITQEELASRIGRSRPQISNTIRLLKLPVPVQQRVAAGVLTAGHARAILSLDTPEAMQRLSDKIVNEDLSVRSAEAAAKMTDAGSRRPSKPTAGARRGHLDEVAERLGDRLNTRVRISLTARRGQISIDFASIQDLNRILEELGETGFGGAA